MLSSHSKSVLYNDGVKVACVAYLLTARADFKQPQVFGLRSVGIHGRVQHLYLYVYALSKTPLHRSVQRLLVFPRVVHHAFASWLDLQSLIPSRIECRLSPLKAFHASEDHVLTLGGRVLSFILIVFGTVVQVFSSDSLRRQGTLSSRTSALMLCTQLPQHLESRTHHNLGHPLLHLGLLVGPCGIARRHD